jgi:proteic killer suppression protein
MILTLHDQGAEDVFNGKDSKAARKVCPLDLQRRARAKLFILDDAETVDYHP